MINFRTLLLGKLIFNHNFRALSFTISSYPIGFSYKTWDELRIDLYSSLYFLNVDCGTTELYISYEVRYF